MKWITLTRDEMASEMSFPALPKGWGSLSWEQLKRVWEIFTQARGSSTEYHVNVFAYLMGFAPYTEWKHEGDNIIIKTRRRRVVMDLEDLEFFAFGQLKWLDDPYTLSALPKDVVKVRGQYYKLPSANLLNYTWQQYNNVQRIMMAIWNTEKQLSTLLYTQLPEGEEERKVAIAEADMKVREAETRLKELQAQFLAHAMLASSYALTETKDRMTSLRPHRVYHYEVGLAESHAKRLREAPEWLFWMVYQVVQSSLGFYSKQFPALFSTSGSGHRKRHELTAEVGTINAVMKYNGYHDQQDVYDSNAVFVFEILNTMTREAEEIKRMSAKK